MQTLPRFNKRWFGVYIQHHINRDGFGIVVGVTVTPDLPVHNILKVVPKDLFDLGAVFDTHRVTCAVLQLRQWRKS